MTTDADWLATWGAAAWGINFDNLGNAYYFGVPIELESTGWYENMTEFGTLDTDSSENEMTDLEWFEMQGYDPADFGLSVGLDGSVYQETSDLGASEIESESYLEDYSVSDSLSEYDYDPYNAANDSGIDEMTPSDVINALADSADSEGTSGSSWLEKLGSGLATALKSITGGSDSSGLTSTASTAATKAATAAATASKSTSISTDTLLILGGVGVLAAILLIKSK